MMLLLLVLGVRTSKRSISLAFSPPVYVGDAMWLSDAFWRLGPVPNSGSGKPQKHALVIGALDLPAPRAEEPANATHHYTYRSNMMTKGHDACPPGPYTLVAAEAHCIALPDCIGFTFNNASAHPNGTIPKVFFKNVTALAGGGSVWHSYLLDYATPWYQSIDGGESWTRFFTDARTQAVPNASFVRTVRCLRRRVLLCPDMLAVMLLCHSVG